jgi:hypothetical protein
METFFLLEEKHAVSVQTFHENQIFQDLFVSARHFEA